MGFPWGKILGTAKHAVSVGDVLGIPFTQQIMQGIHVAEQIPGLKGAQKKDAAKAMALELVGDTGLLSKDPELAKLVDQFIDLYVAIMNKVAAKKN